MLSCILKRYYEPLRLPIRPAFISLFAYKIPLVLHFTAALDLPSCTTFLPLHATPTTPEDLPEKLIISQAISAFPFRAEGQHPLLVNEANSDSLALRPVVLPLQNLQQAITHLLLCLATRVNEQFPGRDFNPLDTSPVTACALTPLI
jgi:hypothetical protein